MRPRVECEDESEGEGEGRGECEGEGEGEGVNILAKHDVAASASFLLSVTHNASCRRFVMNLAGTSSDFSVICR